MLYTRQRRAEVGLLPTDGGFVPRRDNPLAGLLGTAWAHFDHTSIVGSNPVTEWQDLRGTAARDLDVVVGTGANLITLESGVALLTGTAGDKLTAPDNAAHRGTGDMSLILELTAFDWTPGDSGIVAISGDNAGAASTNWRIFLNTTGKLSFRRPSGAAGRDFVSASSISISNGVKLFIKIQFDQDNGSGGSQVDFSTATDGVTYSALGVAQIIANTGAGNSDTTGLTIGSDNADGFPFAGKLHRIQGYSDKDTTTEVLDCDPSQASVNTATFVSGGDTYTIAGDAFVNATRFTGIYSSGSVGLETTAGQTVNSPVTVFAVFKPTLAAPGADQFIFDSRSVNAARVAILSDDSIADKYGFFQGVAILNLSPAYDTNLRALTLQANGDATTKGTVSDVGSVTGDAGSDNWDFGSIFMDKDGANTATGLFLEFLVFDRALSAGEIAIIQNHLEAKYA